MSASGGGRLMSMTGFAVARGTHGDHVWSIDIRSVNGRGLDLRLRLPDWVEGLEPAVRKLFQSRLSRGNVTVNLRIQKSEDGGALRLNPAALEASLTLLAQISQAAESAKVDLAEISAADIAAMRGVIDNGDTAAEETDSLRAAILESMSDALGAFEEDRAREGAELSRILTEQIGRVEALAADAAAALGPREDAARASLERALARLLDAHEVPDEARMMQELALIAVKNDVTEELDRLGAHVAAARELLSQIGPIGRKFDFLMQEFNREANTLCSKSQASDLTAIGLDLKAVIDQMREQVQNVE